MDVDILRSLVIDTIFFNYYDTKPMDKAEQIVIAVSKKFGIKPLPSEEEILDAISHIASTHHPICKIKDKIYYYMCKEDIARTIRELLEK